MGDNQKLFSEILKDAISLRGLNLERLTELTGISKKYLTAFIDADFKNLPPLPYARGYLMKISKVLSINGDSLWSAYKEEVQTRQIKNNDNLPVNRFAIKRFSKKNVALGIAGVFVIIYLIVRFDNLVGVPKIKIISPAENNLIVREQLFKLEGEINNFFDKLTINGEEIPVAKNGIFEKEYQLQPGVNKIEFRVKRFLGREIKVEKEIIYQL